MKTRMKTKMIKLGKDSYHAVVIILSFVAIVLLLGMGGRGNVAHFELPNESTESLPEGEGKESHFELTEADKIDNYLASKGSPAVGTGKAFVDSAEKWQVPADLMVAICGHESNFGKVGYAVGTNNMAGLGIHLGWRFDTYEQFIDKMAETLRLYYFDEGKDNAWKIEDKWAPGYENSYGNEWAQGVSTFQVELENYVI